MLMRKIPIHFPLFISGSIVILIVGLLVGLFVLYPENFIRPLVQSFQSKLGMQKLTDSGSSVDISSTKGQVRFQFAVLEKDKEAAARFSRNLGVSEDWEKGIEIGIDDETAKDLEPLLPLKANLKFEDKKILISNKSFSFLKSALPRSGTEFATGSGKLSFVGEGSKYQLKVTAPEDLMIYATSSGTLSFSKKMSSLFSIGDKIATIELNLNGKSLDGAIVLK